MKSSSEHRRDFVDKMMSGLLEDYKKQLAERQELMCQDYLFRGLSENQAIEELQKDLEEQFLSRGLEIRRLICPEEPDVESMENNNYGLWKSQKVAFEKIMKNFKHKNYLITGPAGSGKSRLMAVLAENFKVQNIKTACTALTAQLASQYHEGLSFSDLLKTPPTDYDVILIDHGNLIPEEKLKELDEHLKFSGKSVCIFADFKQFLPYTEDFKRQAEQSLEGKSIISSFEKISLGEPISEFSLRCFGEKNLVSTHDKLISETFGDAFNHNNVQFFENRIILAPSNVNACELNKKILEKVSGDALFLTSWSEAFSSDGKKKLSERRYFTTDAPGLPDHQIMLKPNCIISMLRSQDGLAKGNRLIFLAKPTSTTLKCRILSGPQKGQEAIVNQWQYQDEKVVMKTAAGKSYDIFLNRKQFPISLAFATTIHRAQGQFFERVGLFNMDGAFDKEAKYTAVTRCRERSGIRIFSPNSSSML